MKDSYPTHFETENNQLSVSLVEKMDPSIGEATTVMGAMMTELLRRTLRGGVKKIGDELQDFVSEKVDLTIKEKQPILEHLAAEVAENTARAAATEVAHEETQVLEQKARENYQELTTQIQEAERRVGESTHQEISQQVQALLERSRKGSAVMMAKIKTIEDQLQSFSTQLAEEQGERKTAHTALQAEHKMVKDEFGHKLQAVLQHFDKANKERLAAEETLRRDLAHGQEKSRTQLLEKVGALQKLNKALETRIIELEKPRGLRALWQKLFGRKKKKAETAPVEEELSAA